MELFILIVHFSIEGEQGANVRLFNTFKEAQNAMEKDYNATKDNFSTWSGEIEYNSAKVESREDFICWDIDGYLIDFKNFNI